jgi:hypothetical protein
VGIDYAPRAIDEARARCIDGATFVVGDVTDLPIDQLGTFSFFFDIGCFQHLDGGQRSTAGRGITALATPAAPRPPLDAGTAVTPGDPTAWALHRRLPRLAPRPGYLRAPAACAHHVPETGCG